jgi:hypothetical protein
MNQKRNNQIKPVETSPATSDSSDSSNNSSPVQNNKVMNKANNNKTNSTHDTNKRSHPSSSDIENLPKRIRADYISIEKYTNPSECGLAERWLARFDENADECEWNDRKRLNQIRVHLDGKAAKFFINNVFSDWQDFKTRFITKMNNSTDPIITFDSFKFDFNKGNLLASLAKKEELAEEQNIDNNIFVNNLIHQSNLPFKLRKNLINSKVSNTHDIKDAFRRYDLIQQMKNKHKSSKKYHHSSSRPSFGNKYHKDFRNNYSSRSSSQYKKEPPFCPECKKHNVLARHWLNECRRRSNNPSNNQSYKKSINLIQKSSNDVTGIESNNNHNINNNKPLN